MGPGNRIAALSLAVQLSAGAAFGASVDVPNAPPPIIQIGSAYVAKQMCSCLFVARRTEASCRPEFKDQGISAFTVVADRSRLPENASVTASLGKLVAEARYSRRYGCSITK